MFFYFKVSSKDSQVLEKFVKFLLKLETSPTIIKYFSKQKKRKFVTILKSPHVNKTAQEQFEFRFYSREFFIDSFKPLTFFLVIKRIKDLSFPGLKLEVKGLLNKEKKNNSFLKVINPDNIVLNKSNFQNKYIKLFDCYGESYLKDTFYN
uniref:Ribosomal protein S10 n=2 Tax=Nitzschia TaxID=2857 RepID=A0A2U9GJ42_9STRA|nr:ribosomal protein S10 [Nitzschia sp. (in: diatoms)]AWQ64312.1 ribosomal protein S10 [Nitzschia sp. (in: diatoms)]BCQ06515.1 ribosomal protein S10 [Nitzschia putrida]